MVITYDANPKHIRGGFKRNIFMAVLERTIFDKIFRQNTSNERRSLSDK